MPRPAAWRWIVSLAAGLLLGGCYSYRPLETPTRGEIVRVRVPVASPLADPNAPTPSIAIEGEVVQGGDTLVIATRTRREFGAFREIMQFDTVRLAPDQRVAVDLREFAPGKSVVLGLVITGGVAGLAAVAFGLGGGSAGSNPGDPPPTPTIVSSPEIVVTPSVLSAIWRLVGG